jgi:alkaline phosphatase D
LAGAVHLSRRSFLAGSASFAVATLLGARAQGAGAGGPKFSAYPFSLGVASGDPAPDGMVLWTRLAPRPREPGGGMVAEPVEVAWQVAEDEAMTRVVRAGTATASAAWAHSVHVEVEGLRPDRWYWYRFKAGGEISPIGRTRTLPPAAQAAERLRFAFVSCQKYEVGFFTAYEHLAREDNDLVVHLGDYIYEKSDGNGAVRPHGTAEIYTLDDYRARYAIYKTDAALQAAHAAAPWIVTWDDHEVSNNYAGGRAQQHDRDRISDVRFMQRRAAAYQAYFEHMPLRRSALPRGPEMLLHRRLEFGRLASFHVLDTRQYRTDQPQGDGAKPDGPVLLDPNGTIMGDRQRDWLFSGLERSPATWNVLAQQVLMARVDLAPGPEVSLSMDKWSGYEFERRKLLAHFRDRRISNPVVITGDSHKNWANELAADPARPDAPAVATEFGGTSITSGGDGEERPKDLAALLAENPAVKYHNNERGYVRCEVTPQRWTTEFKTVPYVTRRGAPLATRATFVVESGRAQLQRA